MFFNKYSLRPLQCLALLVERTKEQTANNAARHKDNNYGTVGYQGPVKTELRIGAGLVEVAPQISETKNQGYYDNWG